MSEMIKTVNNVENKTINNVENTTQNDDIICKYCGSKHINKNGLVNNKNQRYLCRECKKTFTITKRKYSNEYKIKIIKMYLENIGIRSIERLENVPNTTILKWIRNIGNIVKEKLQKTANNINNDSLNKDTIEILEGDEIITYVKKNSKMEDKMSRFGLLLIGTEIKLLILK